MVPQGTLNHTFSATQLPQLQQQVTHNAITKLARENATPNLQERRNSVECPTGRITRARHSRTLAVVDDTLPTHNGLTAS